MKRLCLLLILAVCLLPEIYAQNRALHLDGKDNNVRTGIGFMKAPWTLEAWIKGDDTSWKETEVIFGGGEYSTFHCADNFPLVVRQGKLYSTMVKIGSSQWLDDKWHHVALTCDQHKMSLYLDGNLEATKDTVVTIIPGTIGVSEEAKSVFGGLMDEVRIWKTALSQDQLKDWMYCPLDSSHPEYKNLVAYYNFDEGIDDMALNWVGSGYHSYHLRSGRVNYAQKGKLASTVLNDNKKFKSYTGNQRLFNAVSVESEWDADRGSSENQVMKLRMITQGAKNPLQVQTLHLDLSETTRLSDLSSIHIYYTGKTARSTQRDLLMVCKPQKKINVVLPEDKRFLLSEGVNYLLITADVKKNAKLGDKIRIKVSSFDLSGRSYLPQLKEPYIFKKITENSSSNPKVFRLLQWNIWHGGRHVPIDGRKRIVELAKATKADIITMEEGYGFQEELAKELGYHLQTHSANDNLCLFSRFSLEKVASGDTFCSNPAIVRIDPKHSLLVDNCWTRYSYHPDYTGSFPDCGLNPAGWVAEDSIYPMADAKRMLDKDLKPVLIKKDMPVIVAGDFNSGSHLDWTKKASRFHGGYGPVSFPASRFMLERGYKDSFREMHPDEVARPEGTFAGIYGQLDFSRIDFVYYKGHIKAISSKVVQTMPEIDDIWPSDHSAVLTTFEWK